MKRENDKKAAAPILVQMGIFAAILFIAQLISDLFPKSFVVPTPLIGMILLYILLAGQIVKLEQVEKLGDFIISLIAFLFVPSGIQLAGSLDLMKKEGLQDVFVIIISTIILLAVIAYVGSSLLACTISFSRQIRGMLTMTSTMITNLTLPFTGIFISLLVYLIGIKASNGFSLFTPLLVGMVLGIAILIIWAKVTGSSTVTVYKKFYQPGGNLIFWFLNPATMAFAIPLYRRHDVFKKYWLNVILTLFVGGFIALFLIQGTAKLFGLSRVSTAAMLPQAATTAVAMPVAKGNGGDPAVTAMACILNAVIIYALA